MGLEKDVIETFLEEMRGDARLTESAVTRLSELLNSRTVTQKSLLELIEANASSKTKKH